MGKASDHGTPLAHAVAAADKQIFRRAALTYWAASFLVLFPRAILSSGSAKMRFATALHKRGQHRSTQFPLVKWLEP